MLETPTEELAELGVEPQVVRGVGEVLDLGGVDVGLAKFLENPVAFDSEVEDEGPEEDERVDGALADHEVALASELSDRVGRQELGKMTCVLPIRTTGEVGARGRSSPIRVVLTAFMV